MRCLTTCPMANFALRMGGWTSAGWEAWFSSSMAEVLPRIGLQATHSVPDSGSTRSNTVAPGAWYSYAKELPACPPGSVDARRAGVDSAPSVLLRNVPLADGLKVRFWGVRGSISCSGTEYARYGGNTSCLEVTGGGRRLIFDAGTGIRPLGLELARQAPVDIDIYFTHTHLDHIIGLTFFSPLFGKDNFVRLWAGHLEQPYRLKQV